jgi:uncharacterized repeat protein (TIGR03803 family)
MTNKLHVAVLAALLVSAGLGVTSLSAATQPRASTFTTLYHFTQSHNGEGQVEGALTAFDGVLYGAAAEGGSAAKGTIFKFDLASLTETTLTSFPGGKRQGAGPSGPLTHVGASIYGSTTQGHGTGPGSNGNYTGYGEIWRLTAHSGKTHVFHGFDGADGSQPFSGVTPQGNGFYGVTWYGGPTNAGVVVELDSTGKPTLLYTFPDSEIGCNPLAAVTIVGHKLYGTTTFCGAGGAGTVFAIDLDSGKAKLLHGFAANPNGSAQPNALVYENGALYGTTFSDGAYGSVYKIDLKSGTYSLLHQFSGGADGGVPSAGLTELHGKLYGVTEEGGASGLGTIFSIDPAAGAQTVLYSFIGGSTGDSPFAGLLAQGDALYGSTLNTSSEYPRPRGSLFKFVP